MKYATDGEYIVGPDRHFPYECRRFSNIVLGLTKDVKPDAFIDLGDALDCAPFSKYPKDPRAMTWFERDLQKYNNFLDDVEKELPKGSTLHQLEGNHEFRLQRVIWEKVPQYTGIVPTIATMLKFPERNARGKVKHVWHPIDKWDSLKLGNTVVHHGHYFNKHTAVNNLDKYRGVNILHGHTHRVQYASNGEFWAATLGHGSDTKLTMHMPTPSDWQQAIGILTVEKGKGHLEIYLVNNGHAIIRGKIYKG